MLSFVLGPRTGGLTWELTQARDRKITAKLTDSSEASFTVDGADPLAGRIDELATDLHVLWSYTPAERRQWLYRGRVGSTTDSIDGDAHSVQVNTLDYRAVLGRRHLLSGSQQVWNGYDQAWIAFGLITQTQTTTGGDLGIVNAATVTGVTRDRSYDLGDNIEQRIQELSEVIDGFDWDILPDGPTGLAFQVFYPQRGTNNGVILELGGLAESVTRSVDPKDYANYIRVTGQAPEGGGDEPPPHEGAATDLAIAEQGRWEAVEGTSITTAAALAQRRDWLVAEKQVVRPSYTLKLKPGAWRGPDHLWLGDPVRVVIMRPPRLRVDTTLRVHEISVSPSDGHHEDVEITLGAPRPDYRRRATDTERRLADLERR